MRGLVLIMGLLAASPASAHCYSVWRYPWAQHCGREKSVIQLPTKTWFVEITRLPPDIALPPIDAEAADFAYGRPSEDDGARLRLRGAIGPK